ncbi:hypothetical protein KI387_034156, partial [Taxus chinensis]
GYGCKAVDCIRIIASTECLTVAMTVTEQNHPREPTDGSYHGYIYKFKRVVLKFLIKFEKPLLLFSLFALANNL